MLSGVGELCQPGAYTGMVDGSEALWCSAFTPGGALEMLISKLGPRAGKAPTAIGRRGEVPGDVPGG